MQINKDMLIGELVVMDELACMVHGIDCDDLVSKMNEILANR